MSIVSGRDRVLKTEMVLRTTTSRESREQERISLTLKAMGILLDNRSAQVPTYTGRHPFFSLTPTAYELRSRASKTYLGNYGADLMMRESHFTHKRLDKIPRSACANRTHAHCYSMVLMRFYYAGSDRNRKNIRRIKIRIFDSPENCKFSEVN